MAREPLAAEITLDDLEGYRKDIESVTKEAVGAFERRCREAIAAKGGSFDGESIDRIRDEVAGLMEDCVGAYGDATQSIASRMFEDVLERQGEPDDVPMAGIDFSKRAKASARQWAGLLFRGPPDVEGFVNGASSFVERHVRHSADYCVLEAANGRKFRKKIRYARVPSGPSCGFCIMLASRGFVYASEETAGAFSKFHTGCDCSVIAGYEGLKVAGYDYDGMYKRYEACRKALGTPEDVWREFERLPLEEKDRYGGTRLAKIDEMPRSLIEQIGSNADNFNDYYAHRIAAEMDRRDRRWLYDGETPAYAVIPGAAPSTKEKNLANALAIDGWRILFRPTRDAERKRTSDVFFVGGKDLEKPTTKVAVEFKQPRGNGKQTICHQFEEASGQARWVAVDCRELGEYWTDERIVAEMSRRLKRGYTIPKGVHRGENWVFERAIVVMPDGKIKYFNA